MRALPKYVFIWIFCFFFLFHQPGFAAFSFNIESAEPTTISSKEQPVTVRLSLSDLPTGDSYLRVAWQESEGASYFGYMQNNAGDWVPIQSLKSDCKGYFKVPSSATIATLSAKIGEDTVINPGTYILKAHRFAAGCSYSDITPEVNISVAIPTSTPTPAPTATPGPTATPTPTNTPTPMPTKVFTPTNTPMPSPTERINATPSAGFFATDSSDVLGWTDIPASGAATTASQERAPMQLVISFALIGVGLALISFALAMKTKAKSK